MSHKTQQVLLVKLMFVLLDVYVVWPKLNLPTLNLNLLTKMVRMGSDKQEGPKFVTLILYPF